MAIPAYPGVTWYDIGRYIWISAATYGGLLLLVLVWDLITSPPAPPQRLYAYQKRVTGTFATFTPYRLYLSNALHPGRSGVGRFIELINFTFSMATVAMYFYLSYEEPDTPTAAAVACLCVFNGFFMLRYTLLLLAAEPGRRSMYVLSPLPTIDVITIISALLPILPHADVNTFMTLTFLRVVLVYYSYCAMDELLALRFGCSRLQVAITRVAFVMLGFVLLLASEVATLERAGNLDSFGVLVANEWTIWNGVYWGFVSVLTIGYGDIAPTTALGRMVTALALVGGLVLFSVLFTRLLEIIQANRIGSGALPPSIRKLTVLLTGEPDPLTLRDVLTQLFHPEHVEAQLHLHVVVLLDAGQFSDEDAQSLHSHFYFGSRVTVLKGTVTSKEDLRRAGANSTEMQAAFILTSPSERDDTRNVMRALALTRLLPALTLYVVINNHRSRQHLAAIGVPPQRILSVDAIKMGFLAANCVTPGASTLLVNMFSSELDHVEGDRDVDNSEPPTTAGATAPAAGGRDKMNNGRTATSQPSSTKQPQPASTSPTIIAASTSPTIIAITTPLPQPAPTPPLSDRLPASTPGSGPSPPRHGNGTTEQLLIQAPIAVALEAEAASSPVSASNAVKDGVRRLLRWTGLGGYLQRRSSVRTRLHEPDTSSRRWFPTFSGSAVPRRQSATFWRRPPWHAEYRQGLEQEVCEMKCPHWLEGCSLTEAVLVIFFIPLTDSIIQQQLQQQQSTGSAASSLPKTLDEAIALMSTQPLALQYGPVLIGVKHNSSSKGKHAVESNLCSTDFHLSAGDGLFVLVSDMYRLRPSEMVAMSGESALIRRLIREKVQQREQPQQQDVLSRGGAAGAAYTYSPPPWETGLAARTPSDLDRGQQGVPWWGVRPTHYESIGRQRPSQYYAQGRALAGALASGAPSATTTTRRASLGAAASAASSAAPASATEPPPQPHGHRMRYPIPFGDDMSLPASGQVRGGAGVVARRQLPQHPQLPQGPTTSVCVSALPPPPGVLSGHIVVVIDAHLEQLPLFLHPVTRISDRPVVILSSAAVLPIGVLRYAERLHKRNGRVQIFLVTGDSLSYNDLNKAGVARAARIMILAGASSTGPVGSLEWKKDEGLGMPGPRGFTAAGKSTDRYEAILNQQLSGGLAQGGTLANDARGILTTVLLESLLVHSHPAVIASTTTELTSQSSFLLLGPSPVVPLSALEADGAAESYYEGGSVTSATAFRSPMLRTVEGTRRGSRDTRYSVDDLGVGLPPRRSSPTVEDGSGESSSSSGSDSGLPISASFRRRAASQGKIDAEASEQPRAAALPQSVAREPPLTTLRERELDFRRSMRAQSSFSTRGGKRLATGGVPAPSETTQRPPPDALSVSSAEDEGVAEDDTMWREILGYKWSSRYAAGRLFPLAFINKLTISAFFNPSLLSLAHMMARGDVIRVAARVLPQEESISWAALFVRSVLEDHVVPLGLFRDRRAFQSPLPYVHTNPPFGARTRTGDLMFVVQHVPVHEPN